MRLSTRSSRAKEPPDWPGPGQAPRTSAEAQALFDALPAVGVEDMLGSWRGWGLATGHSLDGLLENAHWLGKRFEDAETVHPLVFENRRGEAISVEPGVLIPALAWLDSLSMLRSRAAGTLFQAILPLLATRRGRARLRLLNHRGVQTAAMLYDHLPIVDVFRRLDHGWLLGEMDLKGQRNPFYFLLQKSES